MTSACGGMDDAFIGWQGWEFRWPLHLSILNVEIKAKEGVGLETAVRVDEALITPATFMRR